MNSLLLMMGSSRLVFATATPIRCTADSLLIVASWYNPQNRLAWLDWLANVEGYFVGLLGISVGGNSDNKLLIRGVTL